MDVDQCLSIAIIESFVKVVAGLFRIATLRLSAILHLLFVRSRKSFPFSLVNRHNCIPNYFVGELKCHHVSSAEGGSGRQPKFPGERTYMSDS